MKLRSIAESFMTAKIREALTTNDLGINVAKKPIEPTTGHDRYETPVSTKKARRSPRLGLEKRPGAIRL